MNSPLTITIFGLALVMTSAVKAYDPMPDPRMSPKPPVADSTPHRTGSRDADSGEYRARSDDRTGRRGEPEFGTSGGRKSGYDYGNAARRGNN
jgi:hypothetical protein